jgi:putative ABC transport system permease protein
VKLAALWTLIRRDLRRTRGALVTSGFGIAAGTGALIFFLALGLGVRAVLLGEVFPVDQVELEPPKGASPGLLGLLVGGGDPPGIDAPDAERLRAVEGVRSVYPKLRFAFPASARGGKEIFGYEVGTSEMIGDGIDPALVAADLVAKSSGGKGGGPSAVAFEDPMLHPGPPCADDSVCIAPQYCERPSGAPEGRCSEPVPALVSRYLIEIFDRSIAPAHNLPAIGETLASRAEGLIFTLRIGESLLGKGKKGEPRAVRARVVGVSRRAIDIGLTFPLETVRRWNTEFASARAGDRFSSVIVEVGSSADTSRVIAAGQAMGIEPKDTRARDVSVLITSVMALLSLVAGVILVVSASNIAYTFRVLVTERRAEIALYRAVGASAADMRAWMMGLAMTVGIVGGTAGVIIARVLALGADWVAERQLPDFPFKPSSFFSFPLWLWAAGLGFAALFAAVGAFGPARRAARVEPASALAGS